MIAVITPVYRETPGAVKAIIDHLSCYPEFSEIIIATTDEDPAVELISRQIGTEIQDNSRLKQVSTLLAGRAVQMNCGAAETAADNLLFLHADTRLPADADMQIKDALKHNNWGRFDITLDDDRPIFKVIGWLMNFRSRITGICTGDQAIFVNRGTFNQLDGFPVQALMEDIAFCKAARRIGKPAIISASAITSARRWQQGGVVKTVLLMWLMRAMYWLGVSPGILANWYRQIR